MQLLIGRLNCGEAVQKTKSPRDPRAVHEGGVKGYGEAALRAPFALVEQAMRPIAEFLVPRQKLGVFAQLALQEMQKMGGGAGVDDVRAGMARAADATEDRMGQMTYDNLFYNKALKDVALLGFRAYGWQLGKYRHLYGAVSDVVKLVTGQGGVTNRMLYPVALTMVAALTGAIVHRLLTGKNPETLQDYLLPQNGQVGQDGRPQRLMMPTYLKDLQSDWKDFPDYRKMGASFYHKLNPWTAAAVDMWRNQDYYGVEIRHPGDPLAQQMKDLSLFAAKQFMPGVNADDDAVAIPSEQDGPRGGCGAGVATGQREGARSVADSDRDEDRE
jgi:hypothetical protein